MFLKNDVIRNVYVDFSNWLDAAEYKTLNQTLM